MRRFILSLAVIAVVSGAGAGSAGAEPPPAVMLPDAACNEGTMTAHGAAPAQSQGHRHIPHMMGMCMTMP